ncbi:hypothetical protein V8E36_004046 [Tilletia maclaganii]
MVMGWVVVVVGVAACTCIDFPELCLGLRKITHNQAQTSLRPRQHNRFRRSVVSTLMKLSAVSRAAVLFGT